MAEVETTRQVDKVVLRDDVLKNVLHAELYKTLREMLYENYREMEKNISKRTASVFYAERQRHTTIQKKGLPSYSKRAQYRNFILTSKENIWTKKP